LLAGLTNARNIFASTLDIGDVNSIHEGISKAEQISGKNKAHLIKSQVFQFDFLNDNFFDELEDRFDPKTGKKLKAELVKSKLPPKLQQILSDPLQRQKLLIYINPPYAEAGNSQKRGKKDVQVSAFHTKYGGTKSKLGLAGKELFAQFLMRIYLEIPNCRLANFSTLKVLQEPNFAKFRTLFMPKLERLFLMPADTFDNVKGSFPIGFFIWDLNKQEPFSKISAKIYQPVDYPNHKDTQNFKIERHKDKTKKIISYNKLDYASNWLNDHYKQAKSLNSKAKRMQTYFVSEPMGQMASIGDDFQHQNLLYIYRNTYQKDFAGGRHTLIYPENLIIVAIYFSVRHAISATWLNDRDLFLYPKKSWLKDSEFHNDCLAFTLFHGQNRITANDGVNHFIPFDFIDCGANEPFTSQFMTDFLAGKIEFKYDAHQQKTLLGINDIYLEHLQQINTNTPKKFSKNAQNIFNAGLKLWQFYHQSPEFNEQTLISKINDASLYDIREYFQGRNAKGKMNNKSLNNEYNLLIGTLREQLKILANNNISPKIYDHGFLLN